MRWSIFAWVALAACGGATASTTNGESSSGGSGSGARSTSSSSGGGGSGTSSGGSDASTMNADDEGDASTPTGCPSSAPKSGGACPIEGLECEYGSALSFACNVLATCKGGAWSVTPPPPCPAEVNDPACPASRAAVPEGAACDPEMRCSYPEGVCWCGIDHTGAPQIWTCYPESGCPATRPRLGTSCTSPGRICDYATCGITVECSSGRWIEGSGACHP